MDNQTQPFTLHDIITPETVSSWPPAIGWWLILPTIVILLIISVLAFKLQQKKWGYRKEAIKLLNQYYQQWQQHHNTTECCQQITQLLKQVAITAYPNSRVHSVYGEEWLNFLNGQTSQDYFTKDLAIIIKNAQYQADIHVDLADFHQACQQWIKNHRTNLKEGKS